MTSKGPRIGNGGLDRFSRRNAISLRNSSITSALSLEESHTRNCWRDASTRGRQQCDHLACIAPAVHQPWPSTCFKQSQQKWFPVAETLVVCTRMPGRADRACVTQPEHPSSIIMHNEITAFNGIALPMHHSCVMVGAQGVFTPAAATAWSSWSARRLNSRTRMNG